MDMDMKGEARLRWVSAGAISLVLHIVVLALFAWSSGDGAADAVRRPEPGPVPAKAADVSPEPQVEAEPAIAAASPEPTKAREAPQPRELAKAKPETKPCDAVEPGESQAVEIYVVKKGDILTHIAQNCGSTIQELAKLNGTSLKKLSSLKVGQKIKIPKR